MNQPTKSIKKAVKSQSRAQDRFAKLEMDFEDNILKYKIPENSLNRISSTVQTNKSIRKNNIKRLLLITLKNLDIGLKVLYKSTFLTIFRSCHTTIVKIKNILKKNEENIQLKINDMLSMKEIQEKEQFEKNKNDRLKRTNDLLNLERNLKNLFHDTLMTCEFKTDLELADVVKFNMDYLQEQMSFVGLKISLSNMISNVQKISLVTTVDEEKMYTSLSIVLDKKGHVWSLMFGKHILPQLIKNYEARNGIIKMNQMWDMTSGVDVLFLEIESETIIEILESQCVPMEIPAVPAFNERVI